MSVLSLQPNCVPHGPMACTRCWTGAETTQESGPFRLVKDAGHWGAANPRVLALGISKGNTQSKAFANGNFDDVGFKAIRHRILLVFQSIGLLPINEVIDINLRFRATETDFAFASVVRCSLTGMHGKKRIHTADSPIVIPAFNRGSPGFGFVSSCVEQHIGQLPPATRIVILFGNTPTYIRGLRNIIGHVRGHLETTNEVAYRSAGISFIHVAHPSRANGHFTNFLKGRGTSGAKMLLARATLADL